MLGRNKHNGALHVRGVPSGLAGDKAGLREGDRIMMIDGHHVDRLTPERVRQLLRGEAGTAVTLTVVRADDDGDTVLHLQVRREPLGRAPAKPSATPSSRR